MGEPAVGRVGRGLGRLVLGSAVGRGGDPIPVADGQVTYPGWAPDGHAIGYVEAPGTVRVVGDGHPVLLSIDGT